MAIYTFIVEATISMHVDVSAPDLATAVKKAQHAATMSLCHQCAASQRGEWSTSGELDAEPTLSPLVDAYVDGESIDLATIPWT